MSETKRKLFDDEDCFLSVTPAGEAISGRSGEKGCSGCCRPTRDDSLVIELDDHEYFPTFCRRCVERMAEAMGIKQGVSVTWTIPIEPGDEGSIGLDALFKAMGLKPVGGAAPFIRCPICEKMIYHGQTTALDPQRRIAHVDCVGRENEG